MSVLFARLAGGSPDEETFEGGDHQLECVQGRRSASVVTRQSCANAVSRRSLMRAAIQSFGQDPNRSASASSVRALLGRMLPHDPGAYHVRNSSEDSKSGCVNIVLDDEGIVTLDHPEKLPALACLLFDTTSRRSQSHAKALSSCGSGACESHSLPGKHFHATLFRSVLTRSCCCIACRRSSRPQGNLLCSGRRTCSC